jgi:hypothetical protein
MTFGQGKVKGGTTGSWRAEIKQKRIKLIFEAMETGP